METEYTIPAVIIHRYMTELDAPAFRLLFSFYCFYLEQKNKKEIEITPTTFKNEFSKFASSKEEEQKLWQQLSFLGLVSVNYFSKIYDLNLTTIKKDNVNFCGQDLDMTRERFRVRVSGRPGKKIIPPERPNLEEYIKKTIEIFPSKIQNKFEKMIRGVISRESATIATVAKLKGPFIREDPKIIEKVCDIYNEKYFGEVGHAYIHGILKNILENEEKLKKRKNKKNNNVKVLKKRNLEKYKKELEDSNTEFAVLIATGKALQTRAYNAMIKNKNINKLKNFYEIGKTELEKMNMHSKLFTDYDWLKL